MIVLIYKRPTIARQALYDAQRGQVAYTGWLGGLDPGNPLSVETTLGSVVLNLVGKTTPL